MHAIERFITYHFMFIFCLIFFYIFSFSPLGFVVRQWRDRSDRPYSGSYTRVGSHRKSLGDISDTVYGGSYSQSNIGINTMGGRSRKYQHRENMKNDSKSATSSTSNQLLNSNSNINSSNSTKENRSSKGNNLSEIRRKTDDNSRNICTALDLSDNNALKFTTPINDKKNSNRGCQESYSSSNPLNSQQNSNDQDDKMKKLNDSTTSTIDTSTKNIQRLLTSPQKRNQMMTKNKSNSELFSSANITVTDNNENKIDNIDQKYFLNSMLKEEESPVKYESLRDAFKMR